MSFYKEEDIPILNKIAKEVKKETLNTNKMPVKNFTHIVTRTRASKKDVDDIIYYFNSIGFIEQRGNTIYRLGDITERQIPIQKTKPGRLRKLTQDEIEWINNNYKPGIFGVKRITKIINKKREKQKLESITFQAIHKYYVAK